MRRFTEFFSEEHIEKLKNRLLFSGLNDEEIFMFIQHSNPYYVRLKEGETVRIADNVIHTIGLMLSGSAFVYSADSEGNRVLIEAMDCGSNSGSLYSQLTYHNTLIELTANQESEVLLINPESLFIAEESLAVVQHKILVNMIASQRRMYLDISEHITCLSQRSIEGKIMKMLVIRCEREHSNTVTIPFSREEMANYLSVDRASLSRSLGELKKKGIIDFKKNRFTLLKRKDFKNE